jgi:hypothetical protein
MAIGADDSCSSVEEFAIVLHKRTGGNVHITRFLMLDLWLLGSPHTKPTKIHDTLHMMSAELQAISSRLSEVNGNSNIDQSALKGMRLDEMLKDFYEERLLQEQSPLCGSVVHGINKTAKKVSPKLRIGKDPYEVIKTEPVIDQKPDAAAHVTGAQAATEMQKLDLSHRIDEIVARIQMKFFETLKLHNLRFAKNDVSAHHNRFYK